MAHPAADRAGTGTGLVTVVGVGADGWPGLSPRARAVLAEAEVLLGSPRQLAQMPPDLPGDRVPWPSPLLPSLPGLLAEHRDRAVCALASGDPMFFGLGGTLSREVGMQRLRVVPHPSSMSLACARLGWPAEEVDVVSLAGRSAALLHPAVAPDRRLLVLSADSTSPAQVCALLVARGYGASEVRVFERLGSPAERMLAASAAGWIYPVIDALNLVAVRCRAGPGAPLLTRTPGLPAVAYPGGGPLAAAEIRAVTLAALVPVPGQLLWDVGAGAGGVAIEWMRSHPACRAAAVERHPDRADGIERNAAALGVPGLRIVRGTAPGALAGLERPAAVSVSGGATTDGVLAACWEALLPGGRLVASADTPLAEELLAGWQRRVGGGLRRITVSRAVPAGATDAVSGVTAVPTPVPADNLPAGWQPDSALTQWVATRP